MTIKELIENKLYDENEQVVIMYGNVNNPTKLYIGRLLEIPTNLQYIKIEQIASMGETRRTKWNLNKYGSTEIWILKES